MDTLEYLKNKYSLDFSQKSPIEIEGISRLDLIRWIRELDFKTGAEIGVESGDFSKLMLDYNNQLKLYGIDPYLKYDEYREYPDQTYMDGIYDHMRLRLSNPIASGSFIPLRKTSMEALKDVVDNSLDFVYIDGNHEGDFPYQDISNWAKKVRSGGLISGHDYVRVKFLEFTIKDALRKYTQENNIHPWFILGAYRVQSREMRDRCRSWAIVKK